ncbi:MAG: helix-turn-helix domain-containing protein [Prevotella sp.]
MDNVMMDVGSATLMTTRLEPLYNGPSILTYGALLRCRMGKARLQVDFTQVNLEPGHVLVLFPNDTVVIDHVSDDFMADMLRYDTQLLREASLQMEQAVYDELRRDRYHAHDALSQVVEAMIRLLRLYLYEQGCQCRERIVLLQLKTFFLAFYDHLVRNKSVARSAKVSARVSELFNRFMRSVETDYKKAQDVAHYAALLNVTPKYLLVITRSITGLTPKTIIDHYVILQLKLQLRTTRISIKELAWSFSFSDVSFFCRYFRKHTGKSPQEYRTEKVGLSG